MSVHTVPNKVLGEMLEPAVCGKSVLSSGGACSRVTQG